jgi:glycosyltransferase involved in cell wall biosynthesis
VAKKKDLHILVLNYLVGDVDEISHLIDDDVFLSECLSGIDPALELKSSPGSARNVASRLPVLTSSLGIFGWLKFSSKIQQIVRLLTAKVDRDVTDVVFPVFDELTALLFMLIHPRKRVHLIFHNNLSLERKQRHQRLYPILMKAVVKRATSTIVSSKHQIGLLKEIDSNIGESKIVLKPHHMIGYDRVRLPIEARGNTVLFLGPISVRKPVEPMIDLINADSKNKFQYIMKNMVGITDEQTQFLTEQPNVDFSTGFMGDDDFYEAIGSAALLVSTHNRLFEGKLSGPISDAIASGTPLVVNRMSPHDEMFDEFGDMGYLVEYDNPDWIDRLLTADFESDFPVFEKNLAACREGSSMENMRAIFQECFTRP